MRVFFHLVCRIKTAINFVPGSRKKKKALNVKPRRLLTLLTCMSKINDLIIPLTKGIRVGNLSSAGALLSVINFILPLCNFSHITRLSLFQFKHCLCLFFSSSDTARALTSVYRPSEQKCFFVPPSHDTFAQL